MRPDIAGARGLAPRALAMLVFGPREQDVRPPELVELLEWLERSTSYYWERLLEGLPESIVEQLRAAHASPSSRTGAEDSGF